MKQNFVTPYSAPEPEPIEESPTSAPAQRRLVIRLPRIGLRVVLWASFCFSVYATHQAGILILTWEWFNQVAYVVAQCVGVAMFYNALVWRRDDES